MQSLEKVEFPYRVNDEHLPDTPLRSRQGEKLVQRSDFIDLGPLGEILLQG